MKITVRLFSVLFLSFLFITCLQTSPVEAAAFSITNLNDSGAGSLRQAILDANALAGADTIEFQTGGTINLLSALPDLSSDITINGISADSSIVRRGATNLFRIFTVAAGANVTLNNLTIQNGQALPTITSSEYTIAVGGAILNNGNLTIRSSKILNSGATATIGRGGGIYNQSGNITIEKSLLANNRAGTTAPGCPVCSADGGGIYNSGTINIVESEVSNSVGDEAIYNLGSMSVSESKITANQTVGINSVGFLLTVKRSSIINNLSVGITLSGRGIIENSTISGNKTTNGFASGVTIGNGAQITNNTITDNQGGLGGVYISSCQSPCKITNNIIAGNKTNSLSASDLSSRGGSYGGSYNLIGNGTGSGFVNGVNGNIVGTADAPVDPQLSPLGDYGGLTPTHNLLQISPAINAANPSDFPPTDQRGVPRPVGDFADIGAVEFNLTPHRFLPKGGLNSNYNQILRSFADNPQANFIFTVSAGNLPPGLSLVRQDNATAVISGIPLNTGMYNFTITATNAENFTISANYNLIVLNEVSFVPVSGKVLSAQGRGIARAFVQLIDKNGNIIKQTPTNPFGFYRFKDVQAQENYVFRVVSKNRKFSAQTIEINSPLDNLNFVAEPLPENLLE